MNHLFEDSPKNNTMTTNWKEELKDKIEMFGLNWPLEHWISSLLQKQREEIANKVEGLKKGQNGFGVSSDDKYNMGYVRGFNEALEDILKELRTPRVIK